MVKFTSAVEFSTAEDLALFYVDICSFLADKMAAKDALTPYLLKMRAVLNYRGGWPSGPTKLFDFLYLAGEDEATNLELLQKLGITHVINCAASYVNTGSAFYGGAIEKYVAFEAEDDDNYNIMQHFDESYAAIEEARQRGGKALIHCIMGINRSGALAVSYAMVHKQWGPIKAAEYVKNARKLLLSNDRFQSQIVAFAQERNLLELDSSLLSS